MFTNRIWVNFGCAMITISAAPLEGSLPGEDDSTINSKGHVKITEFLNTLDQAEPLSGEDDTDTDTTYTPHWHKLQRALLRPIATGNWGCGENGGDPQLKAMLQWMAVSASGRPEMMYFPFNDKGLAKVGLGSRENL